MANDHGLVWSILVLWCVLLMAVVSLEKEDKWLSSPSSINYDYEDALGKAILFFEGQRSGKLPPSQRVQWRGDSALSDGKSQNVCTFRYKV